MVDLVLPPDELALPEQMARNPNAPSKKEQFKLMALQFVIQAAGDTQLDGKEIVTRAQAVYDFLNKG